MNFHCWICFLLHPWVGFLVSSAPDLSPIPPFLTLMMGSWRKIGVNSQPLHHIAPLCQCLNCHCFPMVGDGKLNPIVGVYFHPLRAEKKILYKGGIFRFPILPGLLTLAYMQSEIWASKDSHNIVGAQDSPRSRRFPPRSYPHALGFLFFGFFLCDWLKRLLTSWWNQEYGDLLMKKWFFDPAQRELSCASRCQFGNWFRQVCNNGPPVNVGYVDVIFPGCIRTVISTYNAGFTGVIYLTTGEGPQLKRKLCLR